LKPAKNAKSRESGREDMSELIYKEESYAIMGACFAVYQDKGCGFLEPVWERIANTKSLARERTHDLSL